MSTALLYRLETDRMLPTLSTLAHICKVYGVDPGYLFCEAIGTAGDHELLEGEGEDLPFLFFGFRPDPFLASNF